MTLWTDPVILDGLDRAGNLKRWRELLRQAAPSAHTFEIHCWEDEPAPIALAREHGREKDTGWAYGAVIAGAVTPELLEMLLSRPLPPGNDLCPVPLTPFFSIFFDNGFCSEHYGTELYITAEEDSP